MVSRDVLEDTALVQTRVHKEQPTKRPTREETFVNGQGQWRKGKVTTSPKEKEREKEQEKGTRPRIRLNLQTKEVDSAG